MLLLHDGLPLFPASLYPDIGSYPLNISPPSKPACKAEYLSSQSSLFLAGEPGRPLLLQVPEFPVALLLELRLLLDGDDVDSGLWGHSVRHRGRAGVPGSLPAGWLGE